MLLEKSDTKALQPKEEETKVISSSTSFLPHTLPPLLDPTPHAPSLVLILCIFPTITFPPTPSQELKDHVIIMGYGRSGQLIAQLLSENMIPFVAVDAATDQVAKGKVRVTGRFDGMLGQFSFHWMEISGTRQVLSPNTLRPLNPHNLPPSLDLPHPDPTLCCPPGP